jgi:hypothetical protein
MLLLLLCLISFNNSVVGRRNYSREIADKINNKPIAEHSWIHGGAGVKCRPVMPPRLRFPSLERAVIHMNPCQAIPMTHHHNAHPV